MQNSPLLHCHELCKSYGRGALLVPVLRGINLALAAGEMVALVGRSGSGKSTLLHLLGSLEAPSSGTIFFQQQVLHQLSSKAKARLRNRSLGFIYQFHHLLPDFNAVENVAMPLLIAGLSGTAARRQAEELLIQVGLATRLTHRPATLSGGERQRVAIARALINRPALVLADEPTGDLDQHSTQGIFSLLTQLNKDYGTAFLVVTHDRVLASHFQRQLTLCDGELFDGETDDRKRLALDPATVTASPNR